MIIILEIDYEPGVTFMVAQKRHKTRLFPDDPRQGVGRMGNVPPGTVVDTEITNPTEESFFLASHEGIQVRFRILPNSFRPFVSQLNYFPDSIYNYQGTTKPTGYHKLWDDNNLSPDNTQRLTFYLCHLYARCERSVSYPAPTYYAHLVG